MRFVIGVVIGFVVGCGSVAPSDPDEQKYDAQLCAGNTIDGCGPSCVVCSSTDDREMPTCDGTACGLSCVGSAPTCTDGTCSQLLWGFDSAALDGAEAVAPADLSLRVASHLGSEALAIDVTALGQVSFSLPFCDSGTIDFSSKTLLFEVFFEGGTTSGEQYFVQSSVPGPMTGAYLGTQGIQAGVNTTVSASFADSTFSADASTVTIAAGSLGAPFAGTIWFDNLRIE